MKKDLSIWEFRLLDGAVSPIQMGPLMVKFYHKPMGKFYHKSYGKILTPPGGRFLGKKEKKLEENTRIYSLE